MMNGLPFKADKSDAAQIFADPPFTSSSYENSGDPAATITELQLQQLSYALRSKPTWWIKIKDPAICQKWEEEGVAIDFDGQTLTEDEVKYVLDELEGYAAMRDNATGIQQSCYARIYESDTLISEDLMRRLISAALSLENVPDAQKDWHPRSGGLVLDLVHPSLYCLVYGRTAAFPLSRASQMPSTNGPYVIRKPTPRKDIALDSWATSEKFSWIPTDFDISTDGLSAKAVSYINNLHPSHTDLYQVIEALVARFTSLFDRVLTDLIPGNGGFRRRITGAYEYVTDEESEPEPGTDEDDEVFEERLEAWQSGREIVLPTVPAGGYRAGEDISLRKRHYSLKGHRAQIIVKLANIHLTPEKPEYPGGSWHVEGMANENIVASGIYYYDQENITESQLAFRSAVNSEGLYYQQDDQVGTATTYGLDRGSESLQDIGEVQTSLGRCIAFPNIYQHQVSSFKLADPAKPGHRKIVSLFLVHPYQRIPSTTTIPPQQAHWAVRAMLESPEDSPFTKLPVELLEQVANNTETLMSDSEAKAYRLQLMDERTAFEVVHDERHFKASFNMCEH